MVMADLVKKDFSKMDVEWTAPATPHQNGKVEKKFDTLMGYARALLNQAGLKGDFRQRFWAFAAEMVTFLNNITAFNNESPYEKLFKVNVTMKTELRIFGELGSVRFRKGTIHPKIENRGRTCMFVGYTKNHPEGTYLFYDLQTKRIIISRDVIWLGKMYHEWRWYMENEKK